MEGTPLSAKVVMLGDSQVGKTSIVTQLCTRIFEKETKSTIGGSFIEKEFQTSKGVMRLQVWDTAGQEQYKALVPVYARNANAAVCVFDVENPESFKSLKGWIDMVNKSDAPGCIFNIVANKVDKEPKVDLTEAQEWAKENKYLFFETTCKSHETVVHVFQTIASTLMTKGKANFQMEASHKIIEVEKKSGCC